MNPRTLILLLLAVAIVAHAGDAPSLKPIPPAAPWMTGRELLQRLSRPPTAPEAGMYIEGVQDATEHRDWCYATGDGRAAPRQRPADMQAQVLAGLRALDEAQLRRPAAELLVEIWQARWPCPPDGCCHD